MVQSRVAIKLDQEVMVDRDGKVVRSEDLAFGRKTKHLLSHPNLVLFIDEVGVNMLQKMMGMLVVKSFWCKMISEHCFDPYTLTATSLFKVS